MVGASQETTQCQHSTEGQDLDVDMRRLLGLLRILEGYVTDAANGPPDEVTSSEAFELTVLLQASDDLKLSPLSIWVHIYMRQRRVRLF